MPLLEQSPAPHPARGPFISHSPKATAWLDINPAFAGAEETSVQKPHRQHRVRVQGVGATIQREHSIKYGLQTSMAASVVPLTAPIGDAAVADINTTPTSKTTESDMPVGYIVAADPLARLSEFPDELPADEVVIGEEAPAGGAFADVHRATYKGNLVAVKALRRMDKIDPKSMNRKVQRESRAWWQLDHENILPLHGFVDKPTLSPYKLLVSPWCENGSLADYMEKNPNMTMKLRVDLFYGIAKGLGYLHSCSSTVVHGDLKPANIVLDSNLVPKLCDFGLVRVIHDGPASGFTTTSNHLGTLRYLAPELVADNSARDWWTLWKTPANAQVILRATTSSDVWALGCIGMEIMFSIVPYQHVSGTGHSIELNVLIAIRRGSLPAKRPSNLQGAMKLMWKDTLEVCWQKKAEKRPTVAEVCVLLGTYRKHSELHA